MGWQVVGRSAHASLWRETDECQGLVSESEIADGYDAKLTKLWGGPKIAYFNDAFDSWPRTYDSGKGQERVPFRCRTKYLMLTVNSFGRSRLSRAEAQASAFTYPNCSRAWATPL